MGKRIKVIARVSPGGNAFTVTGQEAKTLLLLSQKGNAGVTAYDFRGGPPFRLPAYCHSMIKHKGLSIETRRESHEGGWHGRFVLHTPIEILEVVDPASKPELAVAA